MKLFLDTNILVDYYARRRPFFSDTIKLRIAQYFGDVELWACSQSYIDTLYILRKALPAEQLRAAMLASLDFIRICSITGDDLRRALELPYPDSENALIAIAADKVKADYIVTRDAAGFEHAHVPVCSPTRLFEILEDERHLTYEDIALNS